MPTLQGQDEAEAAQLVVDFMDEMAQRMNKQHSRFFGLLQPLEFRGGYTNFRFLDDDEGPPKMSSAFRIEVRGRQLRQHLSTKDRDPWPFDRRKWSTLLIMNLGRIDWTEDPDLQGGVCILLIPALLPRFFQENLKKFLDVTFGNSQIRYFSEDEAIESLQRLG